MLSYRDNNNNNNKRICIAQVCRMTSEVLSASWGRALSGILHCNKMLPIVEVMYFNVVFDSGKLMARFISA